MSSENIFLFLLGERSLLLYKCAKRVCKNNVLAPDELYREWDKVREAHLVPSHNFVYTG